MSQANTPDAFSKNQREVLALLAAGATAVSAAKTVGLHRTTINHWMRENRTFAEAVQQAREEASANRRERLMETIDISLDYVQELILDPEVPHAIRLRAAFQLLRLAPARRELTPPAQETKAKPQAVAATNSSDSSHSSPAAPAMMNSSTDAAVTERISSDSSDSSHSSLARPFSAATQPLKGMKL